MSLINKMLQDLDARSTSDGDGGAGGVRPVPPRERTMPPGLLAGGALALTVIAIALAWVYLKRPELPPVLVNVAQTPVTVPATAPVAAAPQAVPAAEPAPAAMPVAEAPAMPVPDTVPAEAPQLASKTRRAAAEKAASEEGQRVTGSNVHSAAKEKPLPARVAPVLGEKVVEGKQVTPQQRIDNSYRRALALLQEGRIEDAMAGLQQTLQLDPRHQGARETLVRLLLEAQRPDEAMRQLQQSLNLDPKQPAQAMMLARLQLDKSGPAALDTLRRTLPYAQEHGDYLALYAGMLQREQRYREAAEQYQAALQGAPDNSVWWMGLGIALQADNQLPQARAAFERAKALQTLSPQLQAFVERKLVQLSK